MLISTRGRYALRVLTDMAENQGDAYLPLKEIAARQEISEKYLESIVKDLVRSGILTGLRGKGGGYRLGLPPDRIGVYEVLEIMEGTLAPVACLEKGHPLCSRMPTCRTLPMWQGLDAAIREYLGRYSIADLMHREDASYDFII
jgi:Rrf2 family protein